MKDYYIKGITLNSKEMSDICRYYETGCVADYIKHTYPNLFSEDELEYVAEQANSKMNDYHLCECEAVLDVLGEGAAVTLKRNVLNGNEYKTFECDWTGFNDALDYVYPDMTVEEFGKEYTPEMGEKLYQWLIENEYIDEDEE